MADDLITHSPGGPAPREPNGSSRRADSAIDRRSGLPAVAAATQTRQDGMSPTANPLPSSATSAPVGVF